MVSKILWIDCETTGLNPKLHSLWELACLCDIDGEVVDTFHVFIKPYTKEDDKYAVELGGSRLQRACEEGLEVADAVDQFKWFMGKYVDKFDPKDKFVPAGKNIGAFDLPFLRKLFEFGGCEYGIGSWMFTCWRDVTDAIGRAVGAGMRFKNHRLETICDALGIAHESHEALSDIRVTRQIYLMLGGLR